MHHLCPLGRLVSLILTHPLFFHRYAFKLFFSSLLSFSSSHLILLDLVLFLMFFFIFFILTKPTEIRVSAPITQESLAREANTHWLGLCIPFFAPIQSRVFYPAEVSCFFHSSSSSYNITWHTFCSSLTPRTPSATTVRAIKSAYLIAKAYSPRYFKRDFTWLLSMRASDPLLDVCLGTIKRFVKSQESTKNKNVCIVCRSLKSFTSCLHIIPIPSSALLYSTVILYTVYLNYIYQT